ncbi:MAG: DtxR family transcriptional regulator [Calditrichaeota bacterium]|nr:MAG: DtxR family transcriptional regulator [Calditrichota bacterium]
MSDTHIDHILRTIWTAREDSHFDIPYIRELANEGELFDQLLAEIENKGMIVIRENEVHFTPQGEYLAEKIIRRHRLSERLFADVFDAAPTTYEQLACSFEHIISPEVTESVCTFLGHPKVCPHNRPIPSGKCCLAYTNEIEPVVQKLTQIPVGENARIVYMLPSYQKRWKQLHQYGLYPGNEIKLIQKKPSYVVQIGETTLALDTEICQEIYVKRLPKQ